MKQYRILQQTAPDNETQWFIPQECNTGGSWLAIGKHYTSLEDAKKYLDNLSKQVIHEYSPGTANKQILND